MSDKQPELIKEFMQNFLSNPIGFFFGAHFLQSILGGGGNGLSQMDQWMQDQPHLRPLMDRLKDMEDDELEDVLEKEPAVAKEITAALGDMPQGMQSAMVGEIQVSAAEAFASLKETVEAFYQAINEEIKSVTTSEPFKSMDQDKKESATQIIKDAMSAAAADVVCSIHLLQLGDSLVALRRHRVVPRRRRRRVAGLVRQLGA